MNKKIKRAFYPGCLLYFLAKGKKINKKTFEYREKKIRALSIRESSINLGTPKEPIKCSCCCCREPDFNRISHIKDNLKCSDSGHDEYCSFEECCEKKENCNEICVDSIDMKCKSISCL